MKRSMSFLVAIACASAFAGNLSAQSNAGQKMDDKMSGKDMKVTGCVAQSADMSHLMLNNAMMADAVAMAEPKGSMMKKDDMMKPMSYMLMSDADLKPHVGHKVEVTGTMAADGMMAKDHMEKNQMPKATGAMSDMHTITVKSVKMIANTCSYFLAQKCSAKSLTVRDHAAAYAVRSNSCAPKECFRECRFSLDSRFAVVLSSASSHA